MSDRHAMTPQRAELHVEELVLHGFRPEDRHAIGEALGDELGRVLREVGLPPLLNRSAEIEAVDGGSIQVPPDTAPGRTGAEVARAVYGALAG